MAKGKLKRKKGHFSKSNVPKNKGKSSKSSNIKSNDVKRTYLRLSKHLQDKVVHVPRSVKHHMVSSGSAHPKSAVLLRPKPDVNPVLPPGEESKQNDAR